MRLTGNWILSRVTRTRYWETIEHEAHNLLNAEITLLALLKVS